MSTPATPFAPPAFTMLRCWQRLTAAIGRMQRDLEARREVERLDGHALRDLGLHRSVEYGSYLAAAEDRRPVL